MIVVESVLRSRSPPRLDVRRREILTPSDFFLVLQTATLHFIVIVLAGLRVSL